MAKSDDAFRTISEVAQELDVPKHVLRFWEGKFPLIRPMKRGGGRRYYRPQDIELLRGIRHLLQAESYTIKGVQRILRQQGAEHVKRLGGAQARPPEQAAPAAPAPKAQGRASRAKSGKGRSPSGAGPPGLPEGHLKVIRLAIRELEACRRMLLGDAPEGGRGESS